MDLAHAVIRNVVERPVKVRDPEGEVVAGLDLDLLERHGDYPVLDTVVVAEREVARTEIRVPPDPAQEILYRYHGAISR